MTPPPPPPHILPPASLRRQCEEWLREDTPHWDAAAASLPSEPLTATLYAKSSLVLAGRPFVDMLLSIESCHIEWHVSEGSVHHATATDKLALATIRGPPAGMLRAERPMLNALAECCGVAYAAHRAMAVRAASQWTGVLAATRKTTPGLRLLQKYAVVVGGMDPHRMDLSAMAMLKDNHIAAAGSVRAAVHAARRVVGFAAKIDVEVASVQHALDAASAGADVVMLDNFHPEAVAPAAAAVKHAFPHVLVEVSGALTIDRLNHLFLPAVDVISFSVFKFRHLVDLSLTVHQTR